MESYIERTVNEILQLFIDLFTTKDNTVDVGKIVFTLIGVIVTSIISLSVAIINNRRSKKALFINTITTNRIDWMSKTKLLVSDFIVMTETNKNSSTKYYGDTKEEFFYELSQKRNELLLHLNFKGYLDKKISQTILEIEKNIQILSELFSLTNLNDKEKINLLFKVYNEKDPSDKLKGEFDNIVKSSYDVPSDQQVADLINDAAGRERMLNAVNEDFSKYSEDINEKLKKEPRNVTKKINNLHNDLLIYTQVYMKIEWERVKKESVGNLKKEKQKKLKKKIDLLITEAKSSKGLDYSFDKLNNYLVDL